MTYFLKSNIIKLPASKEIKMIKISIKEKDLLRRVSYFSHLLAKKYHLRKVYLFGSLAEGLFLKGSDIDLAVEGMDFEDYLKALAKVIEK